MGPSDQQPLHAGLLQTLDQQLLLSGPIPASPAPFLP